MNIDELIHMANQIARFYTVYPEAEATEGVRNHLRNFWSPHMREHLRQHIDDGAEKISPLVRNALSSTDTV
jgi:formate dehydrogenase subunit delta